MIPSITIQGGQPLPPLTPISSDSRERAVQSIGLSILSGVTSTEALSLKKRSDGTLLLEELFGNPTHRAPSATGKNKKTFLYLLGDFLELPSLWKAEPLSEIQQELFEALDASKALLQIPGAIQAIKANFYLYVAESKIYSIEERELRAPMLWEEENAIQQMLRLAESLAQQAIHACQPEQKALFLLIWTQLKGKREKEPWTFEEQMAFQASLPLVFSPRKEQTPSVRLLQERLKCLQRERPCHYPELSSYTECDTYLEEVLIEKNGKLLSENGKKTLKKNCDAIGSPNDEPLCQYKKILVNCFFAKVHRNHMQKIEKQEAVEKRRKDYETDLHALQEYVDKARKHYSKNSRLYPPSVIRKIESEFSELETFIRSHAGDKETTREDWKVHSLSLETPSVELNRRDRLLFFKASLDLAKSIEEDSSLTTAEKIQSLLEEIQKIQERQKSSSIAPALLQMYFYSSLFKVLTSQGTKEIWRFKELEEFLISLLKRMKDTKALALAEAADQADLWFFYQKVRYVPHEFQSWLQRSEENFIEFSNFIKQMEEDFALFNNRPDLIALQKLQSNRNRCPWQHLNSFTALLHLSAQACLYQQKVQEPAADGHRQQIYIILLERTLKEMKIALIEQKKRGGIPSESFRGLLKLSREVEEGFLAAKQAFIAPRSDALQVSVQLEWSAQSDRRYKLDWENNPYESWVQNVRAMPIEEFHKLKDVLLSQEGLSQVERHTLQEGLEALIRKK